MFLVRNDNREVSLFQFLKDMIEELEKLEQGDEFSQSKRKKYLCFWLIFF